MSYSRRRKRAGSAGPPKPPCHVCGQNPESTKLTMWRGALRDVCFPCRRRHKVGAR